MLKLHRDYRITGIISIVITACSTVAAIYAHIRWSRYRRNQQKQSAYLELIGKTPMVRLSHASQLTGCNIFVKMECHNPGGTGKDRAVKSMLKSFQSRNVLKENGIVVEGTSGSTGISLACLCQAMKYSLHIVMPDDQSTEKQRLLQRLGAIVHIVPCCAISNPNHYVNTAKRLAKEINGVFINQFENLDNYIIHEIETGPEIWQQTNGQIDAFVMSAGTGGTIAGVSRYLKSRRASIQVILADPQGSSLYSRVTHGVCFTSQQTERRVRKHRYDSIVEGVGLDRITANFERALIDRGERVSDEEVLHMAHWLLQTEGLFVGSSSSLNVVAACRVARQLGPGHTIVTIICDSGQRHLSRFWNPDYVREYGLIWPLLQSTAIINSDKRCSSEENHDDPKQSLVNEPAEHHLALPVCFL
mmetsp:Transcript_13065/g.13119  ORF Transcript_13065/g.13119 Transcript_13065/m.13119 type:complete len:417 (+) Transcript_13065:141-1391(+)